jgi:PAS domain S-box-containing protein
MASLSATTSRILPPVRAVAALAAFTIVAIGISVTLLLWGLRERAVESEHAQAGAITRLLAEQAGEAFARTDAAMRAVQAQLESPLGLQLPLDSLPVHFLLSSQVSGLVEASALIVDDAHGVVMNSSRDAIGQRVTVGDRNYFRAAALGPDRLYIDIPIQSRVTGFWTMHLSRRISNPDGTLRGIVVAALRTDQMEQLFARAGAEKTRWIGLYRDDGRLLASLPRHPEQLGQPMLGSLPPGTLRAGAVSYLNTFDAHGATATLAVAALPGMPLFVGVAEQRQQALGAWLDTGVPIAAGAALICALIGVAAYLLVLELQREASLSLELRKADDRYRQTVDAVMDAIVAIDGKGRVDMFNPAAARMFGIDATAVLGQPVEDLLPAGARAQAQIEAFRGAAERAEGIAPQFETVALRRDGSEFPVEATVSRRVVDDEIHLTAVLRDITGRRQRDAQLQAMNAELHRLSGALQSVREQERARISRELHDDLGQQLTALKLDLSWLLRRLKEGREPAPENLDSMRDLLDGAIVAVRRLSAELRPLILDDRDLAEAIAWQAGEVARRSGIEIRLELQAAAPDDAVATALFRIVQESLTNVVRHAAATQVEIGLRTAHGALHLCIQDNGRGIDAAAHGSGIGLLSMRERATALGGNFAISRRPGSGTRIDVSIPYQPLAGERDEP